MLLPPQVLPFLTHSDEQVRYHAASYFEDLADASPPETADYFWKAIDLFGDRRRDYGIKERVSFLRMLKQVPQNDASVARAMQLLGQSDLDKETRHWLLEYFAWLPLADLDRHRGQIDPLLSLQARAKIKHRLALRGMTGEQLWDELIKASVKAEEAEDSGKVDSAAAGRIVEALSAHPDFAIPRAIEVLNEPQERYWLEIWCVELLGRLRHAPAIDLLIDKTKTGDGDFLHESAVAALGRMDPLQAVPKMLARYGEVPDAVLDADELEDDVDESVYIRMRTAESLGRMKDPLAETALIQLLEKEDDPEAVSAICMALTDLCTTEGVEQLRQVIIDERADDTFADVQSDLVMLSKMVGYHPPELEEWERQLTDEEYGRERRQNFLGRMGITVEQADQWKRLLERAGSEPMARSAVRHTPDPFYEAEPTLPIRREGPKIGRNDPCPCGSGKKYKKCCGG